MRRKGGGGRRQRGAASSAVSGYCAGSVRKISSKYMIVLNPNMALYFRAGNDNAPLHCTSLTTRNAESRGVARKRAGGKGKRMARFTFSSGEDKDR